MKLNIIFIIILCSACVSQRDMGIYMRQKNQEQNAPQINLQEIKITPKRTDNFRVTPTKIIDIIHADIQVKFKWTEHQCIGQEKILLKPYIYETDSIILDAQSMTFNEIKIEDQHQNEILYTVSYDKKKLKLKLEKKLNTQDTLQLTLGYIARPDLIEEENGKAIRDNKGLYFINTDKTDLYKPTQLWTQGETQSNSCWFPTIDAPNEKFTSTITIQIPKDLTTLSNGNLVSSSIDGNIKTDKWVNQYPIPAYLHMMAIGNFEITKEEWQGKTSTEIITENIISNDTNKIETNDSLNNNDTLQQATIIPTQPIQKIIEKGMEVSYYLEPTYAPYSKKIFANTVEMIQFFSDKLGVQYPWEKYAQVVVRDFVSGAMENTSATLHGDFVQKNARELIDNSNDDIIAHELFHQWFGDLVTCESWSHIVLNEGFASLGEQLWHEYKYGNNAAQRKAYESLNRYLRYTQSNEDDPIINYNYKHPDDVFNAISYQKGSRVLQLLRSELGENAFFLGIKNYLNQYAYSNAEIDDLRRTMEKASGRDLKFFFEQWFLRGGHPIIELRYDYNDTTQQLTITIEQKQKNEIGLFKFPLKFKVTQGGITKEYTFQIEKRKESFTVKKFEESAHSYPNVFVDPDGTFVGEIKDNKPFYNHIQSYNSANTYIEKIRSLNAIVPLQNTVDTVRFTLLSAINDQDDDIRLKALEWINWNEINNYDKVKDVLINIANNDVDSKIRGAALRIIGEKKDTNLVNLFLEHTQDGSYTVAGIALKYLFQLNPTLAVQQGNKLQQDAKGELFNQLISMYALSGDQFSLAYLKSQLYKVYNSQRANLISNYTQLLLKFFNQNQANDAIQYCMERAEKDVFPQVRIASYKSIKTINNHKLFTAKQSGDSTLIEQYTHEIEQTNHTIQQIASQEKNKEVRNALIIEGMYKEDTENN